MSDRRLLVSDADIDIARMILKLDRLDGRESDPATLRVANAAAFDGAHDEDTQYDLADDVPADATTVRAAVLGAEPGESVKAARLSHLVRRRPRGRTRISPAVRMLPAL